MGVLRAVWNIDSGGALRLKKRGLKRSVSK